MRTILLLQTLVLSALFSVAPSTLLAQGATDPVVEVFFTPDMDKADLVRIQEDVKARGVELEYNSVDFKEGQLHHISFGATTKAGSGTATGNITKEGRFGFRYDPRYGVKAAFSIGELGDREVPVPLPAPPQ